MKDTDRFIRGFKTFQKVYFSPDGSRYDSLQQGQSPKTMVIGCSDSRVDPAILTNCEPGDIFTIRNVANLVPPYETKGGYHGVSAAIEFAVCLLGVEHIIVLGHSQCGGAAALLEGRCGCPDGGFISRWMSIAAPALERVLAETPGADKAAQLLALEQSSILLSLDNLRSFPFIAERIAAGKLSLHGWYFDLAAGDLLEYHAEHESFRTLSGHP
ncbi:MAG: carbonic anhydrase [Nitrospinota bacterium]|nr:carbonic anhydrase [Nitrospinota bacterium]